MKRTYQPKKRKPKDNYSPEFMQWYDKYPKKTAKGAAFPAWKNAVERIKKRNGHTREEAMLFLEDRAEAFAASPAGNRGQFTPGPAPWLNQERYDDDPAAWQDLEGNGKPKEQLIFTDEDPDKRIVPKEERE